MGPGMGRRRRWATSFARRGGGSGMWQGVVRVARDGAGDGLSSSMGHVDGPRRGGKDVLVCGHLACVK